MVDQLELLAASNSNVGLDLEAPTPRRTIYLSNWASAHTPGHHGPGSTLSIMAKPRPWEHGDGRVPQLTPVVSDLLDVKGGRITIAEYRDRFLAHTTPQLARGHLSPGGLQAALERGSRPVADGDTLCCACSRDAAARGECHRAWAAGLLVQAGWRVVLDGEEMEVRDGQK